MTLGRQRINLDDQRFVGGVGWRQNEQTYDAGRVRVTFAEHAVLDYSYLWNINRIFGPEGGAQASDWNCECHVLNLSTEPWRKAQLAVFAYQLDLEEAATLASRTLGARLSGTYQLGCETNLELPAVLCSAIGRGRQSG